MRATKSGRDLPLYEIGELLKIGGTGSYLGLLVTSCLYFKPTINHLMDNRVVRVVEFSYIVIN